MAEIVMADVMEGLALLIKPLTKNVYPWPVGAVSVPCAVISYPEIEFDATFGRGSDKAIFPVYFLTGTTADKSARNAVSKILTNSTGIKDALDAGFDNYSVRTTTCKIEEITISDVTYISATFSVEVYS